MDLGDDNIVNRRGVQGYSRKVFHKRCSVLELARTGVEDCYYIVGITEAECQYIMSYNHRVKKAFDKEGNELPEQPRLTFYKQGIKIADTNFVVSIEYKKFILIGETEYSSVITKYTKAPKEINGTTYYYNYGGEFYDYFGAGLCEPQAMWKTILQVIYNPTHAIIFQKKRR